MTRGSGAAGFRSRFLRSEEWAIGLVPRPLAHVAFEGHLRDVEWLPTPRGYKWLADPFSFALGGTRYIVCEGMRRFEEKGHLVVGTVDDLRRGHVRVLAERAHHLSYPFVLGWEGRTYCIPETHERGGVELHELVVGDHGVELVPRAQLVADVPLCDATLVPYRGRFWLFASTAVDFGNRELCIYSAATLEGPYAPHPRNPVKVTRVGARPAGTPFVAGGRLLRPAQDCSRGYGGRIVVQEVTKLTTTEFSEVACGAITPERGGPFPDGVHTLSPAGTHSLVDGKAERSVVVPSAFLNRYGAPLVRRAKAMWGGPRS